MSMPLVVGLAFGVLFLLMFGRMWIGACMALVGLLGFSYLANSQAGLNMMATELYVFANNYDWLALPLFVLMGQVTFRTGLSRDLYNAAYAWLARLPGGLAAATIGASALFAAICGSTIASATAMGSVALPEMKRYGYDDALATGTVCAGGNLGILIPPSLPLIIYGMITEESIGKLFVAGILPGIILALLCIGTIVIRVAFQPSLAPAGPRTTARDKLRSLVQAGPLLGLSIMMVGGLYLGWFTPTEAAAVGAGSVLVVALVGRKLTWEGFRFALFDTARITGMVVLILVGATIFNRFLTVTRVPFLLGDFLNGLGLSAVGFVVVMVIFHIIVGCLMDSLAMMILVVPILLPTLHNLGIDLIWYGILMVLMIEQGGLTPPVGIVVYTLAGVAKEVPVTTIFRGILIFLPAIFINVVIITVFPKVVLWLPNLGP